MERPEKLGIVTSSQSLVAAAFPTHVPVAVQTPHGESHLCLPPTHSRPDAQSSSPVLLLKRNAEAIHAADAHALKTRGVTAALLLTEGTKAGAEIPGAVLAPAVLFGPDARVLMDEKLRAMVISTLLEICPNDPVVAGGLKEDISYIDHNRAENRDEQAILRENPIVYGDISVNGAASLQKQGIKCAMLCTSVEESSEDQVLAKAIEALVSKFTCNVAAAGDDTLRASSERTFSDHGPIVVETIITAKYVLPMYPDSSTVLENHAVVVSGDAIRAIVPIEVAEKEYRPLHRVDRSHHVLLPGFVNTHTHTGLTLLRGCADDQPLLSWLRDTIWPIETAFIKEEGFCYDGALLSAAEMIRGGVTTFADMYWFSEAACKAVADSGIRAIIGMIVIGFPSPYAATDDEYLDKGHKVWEQYSHHHNIHFSYAPHAPYTVSDECFQLIGELAKDKSIPIHTHLHETFEECHASENLITESASCHKSPHKMRPLANFHRMGLLDQHLIAAHMVHLNDEEISLLASKRESVHISHCPSSNAKLASGFAPVAKLLSQGVNVSLGTDSAASNNSLDIISEMKYAALTAKNVAGDPTVVPASVALEMATVNGGKALGLEIGALREGWKADLVCMEIGTHERNSPCFNLPSALVYSSCREDVRDVWVGGKRVLKDGVHVTINPKDVARRAAIWAERIVQKLKEVKQLVQ